jgi:hypothetical protein
VYFYTSSYSGGSFAQSNVVAVMTALTANDPRGRENPNSLSPVEAEDYAAIRNMAMLTTRLNRSRRHPCHPHPG